jgi:hypothetical protein
MYDISIERLGFQNQISTGMVLLLVIILIGYFANTSHSQIIKYLAVVTLIIFSSYLTLNAKKKGLAAGLCVFLGCFTIISTVLISSASYYTGWPDGKYNLFVQTISERVQILESSRSVLHLYGLFMGASWVGLGLIFAYRPSLIQVKNYLPFEYPYPIWNSKNQPITQFNESFILTKKLLTEKERLLSCRFKYLLVSIDGKLYLVSPNEKIPQDSIIMRTKSSRTLCGISRF